jgi:hypothetical protein
LPLLEAVKLALKFINGKILQRRAPAVWDRAASMIRIGDTYSALAEDRDKLRPSIFVPAAKYIHPNCEKCGTKMRLTHSLPRTDIMPAMQALRCDSCGETLIWKSK